MTSSRAVALIAFEQFQLLDLAGPADVLRVATQLGAEPGYEIVTASPSGLGPVSTAGVAVGVDMSVHAAATMAGADEAIDTAVVVGGRGVHDATSDAALLADIALLAAGGTRMTSVCTGAFLLAAAGLLDGCSATTHWASAERLAREHPRVDVLPDRIFVHDRSSNRWTSAGVTAGIDMALALVEADHGPELAHATAARLVVFARRPGGQSQFSTQLRARPARRQELLDLQRWLPEHLAEHLSVATMSQRCGMSERTFIRAFRTETGVTPGSYVEQLRVEAATRLLESTDMTVAAVAKEVGMARVERLHAAVRRQLGTTPDQYRRHFAHHPQDTSCR